MNLCIAIALAFYTTIVTYGFLVRGKALTSLYAEQKKFHDLVDDAIIIRPGDSAINCLKVTREKDGAYLPAVNVIPTITDKRIYTLTNYKQTCKPIEYPQEVVTVSRRNKEDEIYIPIGDYSIKHDFVKNATENK